GVGVRTHWIRRTSAGRADPPRRQSHDAAGIPRQPVGRGTGDPARGHKHPGDDPYRGCNGLYHAGDLRGPSAAGTRARAGAEVPRTIAAGSRDLGLAAAISPPGSGKVAGVVATDGYQVSDPTPGRLGL